MNLVDILPIVISSLKDRKLRTALTILGILVGPATIVALLAITGGFNVGITGQFQKMGLNTIVVMPGRAGRTLTMIDVGKLQTIQNVKLVAPYYQSISTIAGGTGSTVNIIATNPKDLTSLLPGFSLLDGALPDDYDLTGAVIGYNLAFPPDPAVTPIHIDQVISVTRSIRQFGRTTTVTRSYLVKGIANKFGQALLFNIDDGILVSLKAGQILTGSTNYSGIFVVADSVENVNSVTETIPNVLANIRAITVEQMVATVQSILGTISLLLVSVAVMSVLVAFFGIMTTMLTTVTERTREIGLLKALGYSSRLVMLIFLSEATMMGLIGGAIGTSLGGVLSFFILQLLTQGFGSTGSQAGGAPQAGVPFVRGSSSLNISPLISPELIAGALLMAMGVATLAGLIPAWRASRLTPVEALRHE
jgi:putative ABC transport system permease protein